MQAKLQEIRQRKKSLQALSNMPDGAKIMGLKMEKDYTRIAIGLEKNDGKESRIVPLGAANAVAFYDTQTGALDIVDITRECEDRLAVIFQDISALYHPIPKICQSIKERAEKEDIKLKTGEWRNITELINNLADLEDLE